jgi:phosphoglycolate phosphatase-like HAD superfamily hydrolase
MAAARTYSKEDLLGFRPRHPFFVGIDSDGCVFPTMEIKQKKCFHPVIISHWRLEPIAPYVREAAEFVNLYSKWRGQNRFPCLMMTMDLLRERAEVPSSVITVPDLPALRKFIRSGLPLGNPELERLVRETSDPELASVLKWSKDVNALIARTVRNVPPFKWVVESLQRLRTSADTICVSQTPTEALVREWEENGITPYVDVIAGQELGTKSQHIAMATRDRYSPDKMLMIGDAPGDRKAATDNRAAFYPINPGREEASWERFHKEACDRFLAGSYKGDYEDKLIAEFESLLPDTPPWKRA